MLPKIYVDGQEGTTGLKIHEYLAARHDIEVLRIDADQRKDPAARQALLNAADIVFLCLPDAASREAVALVDNPRTRVIDASTAFRTDPTWAYGLPELSAAHRQKIRTAKRVAVPGCHATAFLLAVYPLVAAGVIARDAALTCFSVTGYSGGGKKMIADYEASGSHPKLRVPRHYALQLTHKHLPEMQVIAGLVRPPLFTPVVCNVHSGLALEVFLTASCLAQPTTPPSPAALAQRLADHYAHEPFVRVMPVPADAHLDSGFFDLAACNNTNRADLFVVGHEGALAILTRLDNLGKGASGAAIQILNLLLGCPETTGLTA